MYNICCFATNCALWKRNRNISSEMNYAGYVSEGSKTGAAFTRKWESVAAGPLLVEGAGDTWDTLVLDKAPPCPLHLGVLFTNDPLNHLERTWPEVKPVLKDLFGIQPHSYQGKERNFQGPEIRKVLAGLHKLYPLMRADPIRSLYLDVLIGTGAWTANFCSWYLSKISFVWVKSCWRNSPFLPFLT